MGRDEIINDKQMPHGKRGDRSSECSTFQVVPRGAAAPGSANQRAVCRVHTAPAATSGARSSEYRGLSHNVERLTESLFWARNSAIDLNRSSRKSDVSMMII
jgi:hypothetical protein